MTEREYRCVCCFEKQGDKLLKEIPLVDITVLKLQEIFGVPTDDPMYDVWDIDHEQAVQLEPFLPEKLDLDKFDCSIHCYSSKVTS